VLVLAMLAMAAGLVARTFELQFGENDRILAWARDHRLQESAVIGVRGDILDRSGEPLATSVEWSAVYADPSRIGDPLTVARALAPTLGAEVEPLAQKMSVPGRFVYLQRQVPPEQAAAVDDLALDGVGTVPELHRTYPLGDFAVEIVGSVSTDHAGISGIELLHDDLLAASDGSELREMYPGGRSVPGGVSESVLAVDGADLRLTIDGMLQFEAARILAAQVSETDAAGGVIILARPATGEILAMASVGRDDEGAPVLLSENRAVTWAYEPGSVLKSVVFSGVLEEGLGAPHHLREVNHWLQLYDQEFADHVEYGTVVYTLEEILARSSNTGTIEWALVLGSSRLAAYLSRFGLGTATGLGFKGESSGLIPELRAWNGTDVASFALGQGILATPLQVLLVYNTLANGGVLAPPTLLRSAVGADGREIALKRGEPVRVVSSATSSKMTDMLVTAVREGTGRNARVAGYTCLL